MKLSLVSAHLASPHAVSRRGIIIRWSSSNLVTDCNWVSGGNIWKKRSKNALRNSAPCPSVSHCLTARLSFIEVCAQIRQRASFGAMKMELSHLRTALGETDVLTQSAKKLIVGRYEMSGWPQGATITDWGVCIVEANRRDVELFWEQVYSSELPTQTTEWQFMNGRFGRSVLFPQNHKVTIHQ